MGKFLVGSFKEDGGYLFVAFLACLFGEEGVAAAGLAFAGEGCEDVVLGACSFYALCFHKW